MDFACRSLLLSVIVECLIKCEQPIVVNIGPDSQNENITQINHHNQQKLQDTTKHYFSSQPDHSSFGTHTRSSVVTHDRNAAVNTLSDSAGTNFQPQNIPSDSYNKQEQPLSSHSENSVRINQEELVLPVAESHTKRVVSFSSNNARLNDPITDSEHKSSAHQDSDGGLQSPTFYHRIPHEHMAMYDDRKPIDDFVSFTIVLPAATKQCLFYSPISNFIIEYQVIRGGNLDVGLFVKDPDGEHIVVRDFSPDASLPIGVPHHFALRPYAVCFDNRKASYADKHVALSIDLDVNWENPSPHELIAIERLRKRNFAETQLEQIDHAWKSIVAQLEGLFSRVRRIVHLQQKSDNFASIDQNLMEANLYRVTGGSIIQILTMMTVAFVQILLLRALFDPTSQLYRLWFGKRSAISTRC